MLLLLPADFYAGRPGYGSLAYVPRKRANIKKHAASCFACVCFALDAVLSVFKAFNFRPVVTLFVKEKLIVV
jgi:hypothetical protein